MADEIDSDSMSDDFMQLFADSGDEDEFEGWEPGDILQHVQFFREIDFEQSLNDVNNRDDDEFGWEHKDTFPVCAPFTGKPGLNIELPENPEPIDFFNILFKAEMWTIITEQTNLYATQRIENEQLKAKSRLQKWRPVTVDELKVFFALIIIMGLTRKGDLDAYWSTDEIIATPIFGKMMGKDRFCAVLSNLHLSDNDQDPKNDRLYKVRPFISMMRETFDVYTPEENLSLDEGTCPFKGRVSFKVYNPMKPNKFGIKLYVVCEAKSGYCVGFDIYDADVERSCAIYCQPLEINPEYSHTTHLVIGLLSFCGLLLKGYKVYMDNYYTSPELFSELDLLNTYACGTVRTNRKGVPKAFTAVKRMKQGDGIFRRKGNLLAVKFHDKRDIHMLTTFHEAKLLVTDRVNKNNEPVVKPNTIIDYCKYMGGVDVNDQICQYYEVLRKCVKWWKTLFFHLFNMLLVNVYILHRKYGNPTKRRVHQTFRQDLVRALIQEATNAPRPSRGKGRKAEPIDRLRGRHFPQNIPCKEGAKRRRPMRDCKACNIPKNERTGYKRKQTSFYCPDCDIPLCVPECFELYHTKKHYKPSLQAASSSQLSDSNDSE